MIDLSHYDEARDVLGRAQPGVTGGPLDLATGQLHALLAIAEELHNVRNELMEIRRLLASSNP